MENLYNIFYPILFYVGISGIVGSALGYFNYRRNMRKIEKEIKQGKLEKEL